MLPTDRPLTDAERQEFFDAFHAYIADHGITKHQVARALGLSAGTISAVSVGKYPGDADAYVRKINDWMELDHRRRVGLAESGHERPVDCDVVDDFLFAIDQLGDKHGIGMILGPSGIGKSMLCELVRQDRPGAILMRCTEGQTSFTYFRRKLAAAIRIRENKLAIRLGSEFDLDDRIVRTLRGTNRLLLIDEAHRLHPRCIRFLRDIADQAGVPIALVGTTEIQDHILADLTPDRGQIASRVAICMNLAAGRDPGQGGRPLYTLAQIRKILARRHVRLRRDAEVQLHAECNRLGYGCVRLGIWLIRYAEGVARKRTGCGPDETVEVTRPDILEAWTFLPFKAAPAEPLIAAAKTEPVAAASA